MPENEFEKKVSSEMHELKFKPSEQVWEKVEERIRKKKDRRIFILIFLFAGLALLGYWQWGNLFGKKNNAIARSETPKTNSDNQPNGIKKEAERANETIKPNENSNITDAQKDQVDNKQQGIVDKSNDKKDTGTEGSLKTKAKKDKTVVPGNNTEQNKTRKQQNKSNQRLTGKQPDATAISNNEKFADKAGEKIETNQEPLKQNEIKQDRTEVKPNENKIDSTAPNVNDQKVITETKTDTAAKKEPVRDSAAAAVVKNTSPKKWKWGLAFTPGISSLNDQSLSLGGQKEAADFVYQSPNSSGAPPPPPAGPSEHQAGFSFKLGGFMQGQISKKSQLVFGLQYAYYSEKINVGNKIGSTSQMASYTNLNSSYTASTPYQKVTNSYHFIEAAASYQLRLNKNQSKPFTWNAGFNLGQMVATNALMYDTVSRGIYHKNKDYLNKTQFSLSTGFSLTVVNNTRMQWIVGPAIDIHLNSLLDNPFENKKYLFFAGLQSVFIFNSKK